MPWTASNHQHASLLGNECKEDRRRHRSYAAPINQPANQPTNQPTKQTTNQPPLLLSSFMSGKHQPTWCPLLNQFQNSGEKRKMRPWRPKESGRRCDSGPLRGLSSNSLLLSREGLIKFKTLSIILCPQGWISWYIPVNGCRWIDDVDVDVVVDGLTMRRMSVFHQN